ncbi:HesA/MoeB/ThiF family protein [bacterium]|nr:HesA/MoeB/ThiF family protein [bacterium]
MHQFRKEPPVLSSEERERYSRQMGLPDWGDDGQRRLRESSVFVAGAGGLGSPVALYLTAAGVGHITLADPDTVELSNLNRQVLYSMSDIGRGKVTAASDRVASLNPTAVITPLLERIDPHSANDLIAGHSIVIDCLDTLESRFVLNRAALGLGIPMVYGAVAGFTGHVSLLKPPLTPCLECFVPHREPPPAAPILGCTAGLIGTLQATEAIKELLGIGTTLAGRLLVVDGLELGFEVLQVERDPACEACGKL